jgi:hypothetical protein
MRTTAFLSFKGSKSTSYYNLSVNIAPFDTALKSRLLLVGTDLIASGIFPVVDLHSDLRAMRPYRCY